MFVTNPKNEDGTWHGKETPKCPYCGKGRGDTFVVLRLSKCECVMEGSKRGMSNNLPMWPSGNIHKSKMKARDVLSYDYTRTFPETERISDEDRIIKTNNADEITDTSRDSNGHTPQKP